MAIQKRSPTIGEAITEEVRKDQGETPTFPFSEREVEGDEALKGTVNDTAPESRNEVDIALGVARERAEIERAPGGSMPSAEAEVAARAIEERLARRETHAPSDDEIRSAEVLKDPGNLNNQ